MAPTFQPRRLWLSGTRVFRLPALALIRYYQANISPRIESRQCRFEPSCSQYAYEAIDRHGLIAGGLMAYRRLQRCNPRYPGGVDPVP